jgi:RimJ/RimL family protein N-acetyltransferase
MDTAGPALDAVLHSSRLDLEPSHPRHAEALAVALADPVLHEHIGGRPADAAAWAGRLERWASRRSPDGAETWLNWVVVDRSAGTVVGWLQATVTAAGGEIAYVVGTPWQGRGYATEAARAVVDYLTAAGVARITALVAPANLPSVAVARRLGLRPDGTAVDGELRYATGVTGS